MRARCLHAGTDQFMVLGCDGVFDVLSSQQATNIVAKQLNEHGDVQRACDALVRECDERMSQDNISALVVVFAPKD